MFAETFPHNTDNILAQFDLIDHYLDVSIPIMPISLEEQIRQGLHWDGENKPSTLWNVGSVETKRLADSFSNGSDCDIRMGPLFLAMSLPGSASIFYGDEVGLRSISDSGRLSNVPNMKWGNGSENNCSMDPVDIFRHFAIVRKESVPLYINAVLKFDKDVLESRKLNYNLNQINSTIVVERFYPRRNRYLLVCNVGLENSTTRDVSNTYYGGLSLVSSTGKVNGYVKLDQLKVVQGEGLLLLLDK